MVNRTVLVGRLKEKPTRINDKVVTMTVVCQNGGLGKKEDVPVKVFDKMASLCESHLSKNAMVSVEGRLTNYNNSVSVAAERVEFLVKGE